MVLVQKCPFFQLFFWKYTPGECLLRHSRTKKRVSRLKKQKVQKVEKLTFFQKSKNGHFSNFFFFQQYRQEKYILRYYKTKKRLSCFYSLERPFFCFRISEQIFSWSILPKKKKLEKWQLLDFLNLFFL